MHGLNNLYKLQARAKERFMDCSKLLDNKTKAEIALIRQNWSNRNWHLTNYGYKKVGTKDYDRIFLIKYELENRLAQLTAKIKNM